MPETRELTKDIKVTIARVAALQSVATDPSHILIMTRNLLRWVETGLAIKYGDIDKVPDAFRDVLYWCHEIWEDAQVEHGENAERWPHAMIKCSDVADQLLIIAGMEDMLDYSVLDYNYTHEMMWRMGLARPEGVDGDQQGEPFAPGSGGEE